MCLCLLLVNVEIPIVNTALEGIVDELHDCERSSWVIAAYLVAYFGMGSNAYKQVLLLIWNP